MRGSARSADKCARTPAACDRGHLADEDRGRCRARNRTGFPRVRRVEVLFRFYGADKSLFEKTWRLPDVEKL
jgi:hypothetical protein